MPSPGRPGKGDGLGILYRFERHARRDHAAQGKLHSGRLGARGDGVGTRDEFNGPAPVPASLDEAFFRDVLQVLVHRGGRGEVKVLPDLHDGGRVAVRPDELLDVLINFPLSAREEHERPPFSESWGGAGRVLPGPRREYFQMSGMGEHVEHISGPRAIAVRCEFAGVAGEGGRVAGDVDDLAGREA